MKKREANFQTTFGNYLRAKKLHCNFELKQTTTDSLDFNHEDLIRQCDSLLAAEEGGYYWKHSDQDVRQKPFDGSFVPPQKGYVVIKYPDFFCLIHVQVFVAESKASVRRSLTSQRAREIAEIIVV